MRGISFAIHLWMLQGNQQHGNKHRSNSWRFPVVVANISEASIWQLGYSQHRLLLANGMIKIKFDRPQTQKKENAKIDLSPE